MVFQHLAALIARRGSRPCVELQQASPNAEQSGCFFWYLLPQPGGRFWTQRRTTHVGASLTYMGLSGFPRAPGGAQAGNGVRLLAVDGLPLLSSPQQRHFDCRAIYILLITFVKSRIRISLHTSWKPHQQLRYARQCWRGAVGIAGALALALPSTSPAQLSLRTGRRVRVRDPADRNSHGDAVQINLFGMIRGCQHVVHKRAHEPFIFHVLFLGLQCSC